MAQTNEPPKEESSTFVRPKKRTDWRIVGIRIGIVAVVAAIVCLFVLRPMIVDGGSMAPTYSGSSFTLVFLPYFKMYSPQRGQIVILKDKDSGGYRVKRVIALPGDTVEIRKGVVYIGGKAQNEPYVKEILNRNYHRRTVEKNDLFVLGDDRSKLAKENMDGMVSRDRLAGVPIW